MQVMLRVSASGPCALLHCLAACTSIQMSECQEMHVCLPQSLSSSTLHEAVAEMNSQTVPVPFFAGRLAACSHCRQLYGITKHNITGRIRTDVHLPLVCASLRATERAADCRAST